MSDEMHCGSLRALQTEIKSISHNAFASTMNISVDHNECNQTLKGEAHRDITEKLVIQARHMI